MVLSEMAEPPPYCLCSKDPLDGCCIKLKSFSRFGGSRVSLFLGSARRLEGD